MDADCGIDNPEVLAWSDRSALLAAMRSAIREGTPFAAGKIGYSEQVWLNGQALVKSTADPTKFERAVRASATFHACMQCGVFPSEWEHIAEAAEALSLTTSQLDFLAVHDSPLAHSAIQQLHRTPKLLSFNDLEPNKDCPYAAEDCYLPELRDRRILLVTTPADLLVGRATHETFEAIWAKIQCPWFFPESVAGVSFDSLFSSSIKDKYASSLELLTAICDEVDQREFDVALVGASSLGIPIAAHVKSMGKVGISLGGHLQVLFGVQGGRWRTNPHWQQTYVTEAWMDMPPEFRPDGRRWLVDDGAYW